MYIELYSKRAKSGHERVLRKSIFLTFPHDKTTFQWSKVVSEAIFSTFRGIRGMFLLRSGLRFSFRALEVPEPRVRKMSLSL